jgi:hypothetical protein
MNTKHEHSTRKIGGTEKENWWDCPLKIKGKKGEREKRKNKMNQACLLLESFKLKVVIVFINSIYL